MSTDSPQPIQTNATVRFTRAVHGPGKYANKFSSKDGFQFLLQGGLFVVVNPDAGKAVGFPMALVDRVEYELGQPEVPEPEPEPNDGRPTKSRRRARPKKAKTGAA